MVEIAESSIRRSKRNRIPVQFADAAPPSKATTSGVNNVSRASSLSDGEAPSPDDDFEDAKPKRKRAAVEGTSSAPAAAAKLSVHRLIDVIKGDKKFIKEMAKLWVEHYEKNPKVAMAELLAMLFEACGARDQFRGDILEDADTDDVVLALVKLARDGEVEDNQNSKKKEYQNFKDNLLSFWDNLVIECQSEPLFDKVLFDKCMDYVIALSCTPPRVYRRVASMVGLQLVTSYITVAKMLGAQRETTQRQLNAEKKKQADVPRMESLNIRLSVTHERITILEEMMRKIFTGLFVHRYRDIDPNIRMSCIESLGVWIMSYPSMFLQDLYLKYLGWTLNDKSSGVRKASVLALQNLYQVDDNVPSLGLFTERFSNRMIELADDVDISVAVSGIGLVKQLLRHQLLADDDLGPLYDLLIDDPSEIRRAIGALVYDHLIAQETQSGGKADNGDSSEVHLGRMLRILEEFSADTMVVTYVIDDLWEYMPAMKNWKCIISMLLDESTSIELTDQDATNLIRLLSTSVQKAVGERVVLASDNRKQNYTKAQKEQFEISSKEITVVVMKNYSRLLRKFMADKAKVPSLGEIILHINLELFSLKRQEQNFKSILQLLKETFFKHGDKDALRSCVKAINFCSTGSRGELHDFAQSKLKELEDELIAKLKSAMKEAAESDDDYSLLINLKRLYELQLSRYVPIESLFQDLVESFHSFKNTEDEVVSFLLLNMYLHVAWCLNSIVNSGAVSEASVSSLLSKRTTLLEALEYFLNPPVNVQEEVKYGNQLACRVCTILAEVWCLFKKTAFSSTKLECLGYCPDSSVLKKFWKLCEQQLDISDETDEEANKEYVEETNHDAVMIAASKLVAFDVVPKDYLGPEIISHFVMHGASVAEIVKYLVSYVKKKSEIDVPNLFLEALKRAYTRYMTQTLRHDDESLASKLFLDCKDLSVRLSGTFMGTARNKHKSDILKIVNKGVEYAFINAPSQLSFLEVAVLHFVSKLPPSDVVDILKDVQKRTENVNTDEDPSGWRPYITFRDTLRDKYAKNEVNQEEKEKSTVRRRARPGMKRNLRGKKLFDEHSSSEDEESISASEQNDQDEENEDDDLPLIHSFKSSAKLRSLRVSRDKNEGQARTGSSKDKDNATSSKTSGASKE